MGSLFKRNNSWVIEYRGKNGRMKRKSLGSAKLITKSIARQILTDIERDIKLGRYDMIDAVIPTIVEYAQEYIDYQRDIKKIKSHRRSKQALSNFSELFGDMKLSEVTTDEIDAYKNERHKEGIKMNTIGRDLIVIRHFFNHAAKRKKFFGINPVSQSGIENINDQIENIVTVEEEIRLLQCSPQPLKDILKILFNTGMRIGETLPLKWEWIDFDNNIINLPHTHTKNQTSRRIPINSVLRQVLILRKLKVGSSCFVFPSKDSSTGHLVNISKLFNKAKRDAGLENLRLHDIRHTVATRLIESGMPIHTVSKLLGHSSVKITERYSHPEETVKKATDLLANYAPIETQDTKIESTSDE